MNLKDNAHAWWMQALLGQQSAAHPIFGRKVRVDVQGDVVILTGSVDTADEVEQIEREARSIDTVKNVINHVSVDGPKQTYHMQTVLAVFRDENAAELARRAMASWTFHDEEPAELFCRREDAERYLADRAAAAHVKREDIESYLRALECGKVLVIDRVPEDDALRLVSALEGTHAEAVRTLPPEPDTAERY